LRFYGKTRKSLFMSTVDNCITNPNLVKKITHHAIELKFKSICSKCSSDRIKIYLKHSLQILLLSTSRKTLASQKIAKICYEMSEFVKFSNESHLKW
jgi:hypothetical protein